MSRSAAARFTHSDETGSKWDARRGMRRAGAAPRRGSGTTRTG